MMPIEEDHNEYFYITLKKFIPLENVRKPLVF